MSRVASLKEIACAFLKLGCVSFGGPVAHLGYLRDEFVTKRAWLDDAEYADLVALCQFLPGPASSQVVFALGMRRAGPPGACVASFFFTLPSAVAMGLFALGWTRLGDLRSAGWTVGLTLAAAAVVAHAITGMWRNLCPDTPRRLIALCAALAAYAVPGAFSQIGLIAAGALASFLFAPAHESPANDVPAGGFSRKHLWATGALGLFAALLLATPFAAPWSRHAALFDCFYRAGSLVFGGGHVVLPLLSEALVRPGLISGDAFLAGYGAAQALPGPLFTFSVHLGTVITGGLAGGALCLVALFLPGWLLVGGALPFWDALRRRVWARAALRGANAAVVGLLIAALCGPIRREGLATPAEALIAAAAFALLAFGKRPAWQVVPLCVAAGCVLVAVR